VAGPLVDNDTYLQTLQQAATRLGGEGVSGPHRSIDARRLRRRVGSRGTCVSPLEATAMTFDPLLPTIASSAWPALRKGYPVLASV